MAAFSHSWNYPTTFHGVDDWVPGLPGKQYRAIMNVSSFGLQEMEGSMCGRAFLDYDLCRHTSAGSRRSLLEWLRELWRPWQPQSQTSEAEVVPFLAARASHAARETDRKNARAA